MTLADDLLSVAYEARGIAGGLGFRTHRVYVIISYWAGQHTGEQHDGDEVTELLEGDGQPPRVVPETDEEIALGQLPNGTLRVGPITPEFATGGTSDELLFGAVPVGATKYFRVVGPIAPNGARYRLVSSQRHKALRRVLQIAPVAPEP